jgi:hypothetical protein
MKRTIIVLCLLLLAITNRGAESQAQDKSPVKFDEFTGTNWESAMAHLDSFAVKLQTDATAMGVIVVYGGQNRRRFEPDAWSKCAQDYLVTRRGLDPTRIVIALGGYRDDITMELWETTDKTNLPKTKSTVTPSDIKFSGEDIKKWQTICGS